jgi:hypothetical protein
MTVYPLAVAVLSGTMEAIVEGFDMTDAGDNVACAEMGTIDVVV